MRDLIIRHEVQSDHDVIRAVTRAAFEGMPYAAGNEYKLPALLRAQEALVISLVADCDGIVIGHIAVSPAFPEDGSPDWYAIGPVSVVPSRQRAGVGTELIDQAMELLVARAARGCVLTGDPGYYRRFDFRLAPESAPDNEPPEYFMMRLLNGPKPKGKVSFHPAFYQST